MFLVCACCLPSICACIQRPVACLAAQLPPTLKSEVAKAAAFSQSLFERLQRGGAPVCMLKVQYRMHPAISR